MFLSWWSEWRHDTLGENNKTKNRNYAPSPPPPPPLPLKKTIAASTWPWLWLQIELETHKNATVPITLYRQEQKFRRTMTILETLAAINYIPAAIYLLVVNVFFVMYSLQLNRNSQSVARYLFLLGMIKETLPCFAAWMPFNWEEADSCSSFIRPSPTPRDNGQAKR